MSSKPGTGAFQTCIAAIIVLLLMVAATYTGWTLHELLAEETRKEYIVIHKRCGKGGR